MLQFFLLVLQKYELFDVFSFEVHKFSPQLVHHFFLLLYATLFFLQILLQSHR